MKYWTEINYYKGMSYELAKQKLWERYYVTRPSWDGVHFYDSYDNHKILLKNGIVIDVEDEEVYSKEENDWCTVSITSEAFAIVGEHV